MGNGHFMKDVERMNSSSKREFAVLSWNLKMLNEGDVWDRVSLASRHLIVWRPDVIMLQEMSDEAKDAIKRFLHFGYRMLAPMSGSYTDMMLFRRDLTVTSTELVEFNAGPFARSFLKVVVELSGTF